MRKHFNLAASFAVLLCLLLSSAHGFAQMKSFTWDTYKTKFKVPQDFVVDESTGNKWTGHNSNITLSIYPRKGENLSRTGMRDAVRTWAIDNGVKDIGAPTELDETKLNGYWGVMYEGYVDGFPVATMLIVDPDYPDISIYIWVSYREGWEDTVIDVLMSFTPI